MADYPAIDLRFTDFHAPGGPDDTLQDRIYVTIDEFAPLAIQEAETGDRWRVFFRTPAVRDKAAAAILAALPAQAVDVTTVDVPDEDWARRSQQNLKAVRAGRLVIAPPWDVPKSGADPVIIIEPSTGFGTGHHATTRMCLRLLSQLDIVDATVIDLGTGSGVLSMAAALMGARSVIGIDIDQDAIDSAEASARLNTLPDTITFTAADFRSSPPKPADVVLANLTGGMLTSSAGAISRLVRNNGHLIVSGFDHTEVDRVVEAFAGFTQRERVSEDDWIALHLTR